MQSSSRALRNWDACTIKRACGRTRTPSGPVTLRFSISRLLIGTAGLSFSSLPGSMVPFHHRKVASRKGTGRHYLHRMALGPGDGLGQHPR